jgi:hypothetical protein
LIEAILLFKIYFSLRLLFLARHFRWKKPEKNEKYQKLVEGELFGKTTKYYSLFDTHLAEKLKGISMKYH